MKQKVCFLSRRLFAICNVKYSLSIWKCERYLYTVSAAKQYEIVQSELPQFKVIRENFQNFNNMFVSVKNRRMRYKKSIIMLEGVSIIQDALNFGILAKTILFSDKEIIRQIKFPSYCYNEEKAIFYKVPYKFIQMWSDLSTSPGIIGIFEMPELSNNNTPIGATPLIIVCDNIREPGNLGSILRIAAAIPCMKVMLTKGCVDIWDTKVIRASCGSYLQIPIINNAAWDEIRQCEGNVIIADNSLFCNNITEEYKNESGSSVTKPEIWNTNVTHTLPIVPYYAIQYNKLLPIILIIGGETEAISPNSVKFASNRRGLRVNIPLSNYVDSLNSAIALGIIAFEIKKQSHT